MIEKWRDIPGVAGYQASNIGRLRSLDKQVKCGRDGSSARSVSGRVLKPFAAKTTGYLQVAIGKRKLSAHRLVAFAWCDGYFEGACVDHVNGIRTDNRPENLEWVTLAENQARSYRNGRAGHCKGKYSENHPTSKPVVSTCIASGQETIWPSSMDAVRSGFDSSCISRCCNGQSATHKGHTWKFIAAYGDKHGVRWTGEATP